MAPVTGSSAVCATRYMSAASPAETTDEIAIIEPDGGRKSRIAAIDETTVDYFNRWH